MERLNGISGQYGMEPEPAANNDQPPQVYVTTEEDSIVHKQLAKSANNLHWYQERTEHLVD